MLATVFFLPFAWAKLRFEVRRPRKEAWSFNSTSEVEKGVPVTHQRNAEKREKPRILSWDSSTTMRCQAIDSRAPHGSRCGLIKMMSLSKRFSGREKKSFPVPLPAKISQVT
jgi:hypothetical protein